MATVEEVIRIAEREIGYDRNKDPKKGSKYGRWYEENVDKNSRNYDYGGNGVAYCAMFASWVLDQAGVKAPGMPSAYCPAIHHKQHLKKDELQRGDLVLFDWGKDGVDDHIGIVVRKVDGGYETIEGNTNGGKVCRRTRALSTVCGGIRPLYEAKNETASKPVSVNAGTKKFNRVGRYVTVVALNVRTGPGTKYRKKKKSELTAYAKRFAYLNGVLRSKTVVDVSATRIVGQQVWGKIPSGWICLYSGTKGYVE